MSVTDDCPLSPPEREGFVWSCEVHHASDGTDGPCGAFLNQPNVHDTVYWWTSTCWADVPFLINEQEFP